MSARRRITTITIPFGVMEVIPEPFILQWIVSLIRHPLPELWVLKELYFQGLGELSLLEKELSWNNNESALTDFMSVLIDFVGKHKITAWGLYSQQLKLEFEDYA